MGRGSTVLALGFVLVVLVGAVGAAAGTPAPPPAAYYGSLTVDGDPAPAGLTVTAEIDGEQRGSLTTGDAGRYGGPGAFDPKLQVDGTDGDEGATVHFFVEGESAGTATWRSGDVREVALSATGVSVPTPEAGSGGGSGGSGGVPLVPPSTPTETPMEPGSSSTPTVTVTRSGDEVDVAVTDARAGDEVEVQPDATTSHGIGLDGIAITPRVNGSFTLNASLLANPPAGTPPLPAGGNGIGFLQVDHSIADADIDGVTFRFRASKQRLADAGLDADAVTLYRLHEGDWSPLPTTRVDESTTDYVFEADSPGLSLFAIGQRSGDESTPTESETPVSTSVPDEDESPATETRTDGSGPRFGSLVALLALLSTVALLRYRHR
ncbi:PGF-pre-PGF domain-containing protein [Halomontanus rarus]|uniref:PGF-pre-PGF domain-containing protein n=1 Tax=Halomontanus rarus TaxID=3034020 RepID=UPI0023E88D72|nr:PGF-pre-PGF domain-containing protein [Halovivax sp. TS33]